MYINIPITFKRNFQEGGGSNRNVRPLESMYDKKESEHMSNHNIYEGDNGEDKHSNFFERIEKDFKPPKVINNYEVLDFKKEDVTGDGFSDYVYLLGKGVKDSPNFKKDIIVFVEDGRNKRVYYMDMKSNSGYEPNLFLGDFTGDGINDILVSIASGGSGGFYFYYIFSFRNGDFVKIFDYEDFSQNQKYNAIYRDNYRVEVISEDGKERYSIDISNRSREYLDQFYDKNGKLKKPTKGDVSNLNTLFPIYPTFGLKGKFGLLTLQRITGTYSADGLGYLQTYVNYEDNVFKKAYSQVAVNAIGK